MWWDITTFDSEPEPIAIIIANNLVANFYDKAVTRLDYVYDFVVEVILFIYTLETAK